MVELRKRKNPPHAPAPAAKKATKPKRVEPTKTEAAEAAPAVSEGEKPTTTTETAEVPAATSAPVTETKKEDTATTTAVGPAPSTTGEAAEEKSSTGSVPEDGETIKSLDSFGGKFQLDDGSDSTLAGLLSQSGKGIIIFTYPKASTPGCTKQACLFRDAQSTLTSASYSTYGLSRDSPKSNTTFKQKQSLSYPLICDIGGTLLKALGFHKAPKSAVRGVVVIEKGGKILGRMEGGPDATLDAARKLVEAAEEKGEGGVEKEAAKI